MMIIFLLLGISLVASAQQNRVINFSFEQASGDPTNPATGWTKEWGSYERADTTTLPGWDGHYALKLSHTVSGQGLASAVQRIVFNQSVAVPILITARIRGTGIADNSNEVYGASLYCRVRYQNGSNGYCSTTLKTKNIGTFSWRYVGVNTATLAQGTQPIAWVEIIPTLGDVVGTVWFDDIHAAEYPLGLFQGAVTIMPDDGFKEQITFLMPAMASYGWKGTIALVSNYLQSGDQAYMNVDDMFAMRNAGWEIASHTVNHPDLTLLTPAQMEGQMYASRKFFLDRGIAVKTLVLPFGAYNGSILGLNSERGYYKSVRKVERDYNPMGAFPYDIKVQELKVGVTLADVNTWLTEARSRKAWLVILLHKIRSTCPDLYCTSPELVQTMLTAIQSSGLPVVTYEEGLNLVKSPR